MIPRSARLGVLADAGFRSDLARIARETGLTDQQVTRAARKYLREVSANPWPLVAGFAGWAAGMMWRRNYRTVHYDPGDLERLAELGTEHPLVFLPSHKSQLDHIVLHNVLWRNGRPPNYTASGINMNFFLLGPILRRSGSFFIRRRIGDRPIYKRVLRAYLAHILEQGHPVEWYIEGTRSRTGKVAPPTYGLLTYAAEALWSGRCYDIHAVPVSISYDHVEEIQPYIAEQRGASKRRETFVWMIKSILMMGRNYGDIHVRFGQPISMGNLFANHDESDRRGMVAALGRQVCSRINQATPVTAPSLVASAILGSRPDAGLTMERLIRAVDDLVEDAASRGLPTADALAGSLDRAGLERIADTLARRGIVTIDRGASGPGGASPTYRIEPDQRLAASFYRNTIAHHFVVPAAAEVAIASAGRVNGNSLVEGFHDRLSALHGLLETDFFLPDPESFAGQVRSELTRRVPAWESLLVDEGPGAVLDRLRPHRAPWALRHFLEAYWVVAGQIEEQAGRPSDTESFLRSALDRSLAHVRRERISPEAASLSLLAAGLGVATRHDPGTEALAAGLARFLEAIKTLERTERRLVAG